MVLWFPLRGVLPGLWLEIRLEMLSLMVSWFPPRGVMVSSLVCGLKLDWKCYPSWFPPSLAWLMAQN